MEVVAIVTGGVVVNDKRCQLAEVSIFEKFVSSYLYLKICVLLMDGLGRYRINRITTILIFLSYILK